MAANETRATDLSIDAFLATLAEPRQSECRALAELMEQVTGAKPRLWGKAIVGFGDYHYTYASGREGDWFCLGFSPRKSALTLYCGFDIEASAADLLPKLGKHKLGKGCLYLKRLADADIGVLTTLLHRTRLGPTS
ncbi:MAG: DUF1801 domain-containing protein [Myxococcales bacterium]|nr:DUF1801 domain-containing protein [Myxococcales bacterium]